MNVLLPESGITAASKRELGEIFLRMLGEDRLVDSIRGDLAMLAVEIQSRVASAEEARELRGLLGTGFKESQARRVTSDRRGLVAGQRRLEWMAGFLVMPHYQGLAPVERRAISQAFRKSVASKRLAVAKILSASQQSKLYGDLGYDSPSYWRRRLKVPASDDD